MAHKKSNVLAPKMVQAQPIQGPQPTLLEQMQHDRERREAQCVAEVNAALKKWDCLFDPLTTIDRGGIVTQVRIVAR